MHLYTLMSEKYVAICTLYYEMHYRIHLVHLISIIIIIATLVLWGPGEHVQRPITVKPSSVIRYFNNLAFCLIQPSQARAWAGFYLGGGVQSKIHNRSIVQQNMDG